MDESPGLGRLEPWECCRWGNGWFRIVIHNAFNTRSGTYLRAGAASGSGALDQPGHGLLVALLVAAAPHIVELVQ
jgi:hypothetical protein